MTTALLVIDVQESFRKRADWDQISAPDIVERVARLVDHSRDQGHEVIWVLHTEPGSGAEFDPVLGLVELMPGLTPLPEEIRVHKTSHNAFTSTNLAQRLTARGVRELVICGIRTEQCCETTARVGSDLGYAVRFVLDATATHPLAGWDGSGTLSADDILARTAAALHGRFAEVVRLQDVVSS